MTIRKQVPEATHQYWANLDEIKAQITVLQSKLYRHEQQQAKQPENYGFTGDLAHVLGKLQEINNFFNS